MQPITCVCQKAQSSPVQHSDREMRCNSPDILHGSEWAYQSAQVSTMLKHPVTLVSFPAHLMNNKEPNHLSSLFGDSDSQMSTRRSLIITNIISQSILSSYCMIAISLVDGHIVGSLIWCRPHPELGPCLFIES